MALKQVTGNVDYIKWSEVDEGSVIKGFYKETKASAKYPDNMNHYIETEEGKVYGLNGSANLDRALDQVRQGWWVQITYQGQITLENGRFAGRPCHQFDVAYDDERVHPLFSGDASARKEVNYKNAEAQQPKDEAPALVRPQQQAAAQAPPSQAPAAAAPPAATQSAAPSAAPPATQKRKIF